MIINVRQFDPQKDAGFVSFQGEGMAIQTGADMMTAALNEEVFASRFIQDGCWLALDENGIIGAVVFGNCAEDAKEYTSVYGINVDERYRRKGIGGLLMLKADLYADRSGLKQLIVRTGKNNTPALNFFQKCWFKVTETGEDSVTMVKTRMRRR